VTVVIYCVGCGDIVHRWPCARCGHKYVRVAPVDVQLKLFYELVKGEG
jgi:rRNA maturation endonuclease Nob1